MARICNPSTPTGMCEVEAEEWVGACIVLGLPRVLWTVTEETNHAEDSLKSRNLGVRLRAWEIALEFYSWEKCFLLQNWSMITRNSLVEVLSALTCRRLTSGSCNCVQFDKVLSVLGVQPVLGGSTSVWRVQLLSLLGKHFHLAILSLVNTCHIYNIYVLYIIYNIIYKYLYLRENLARK